MKSVSLVVAFALLVFTATALFAQDSPPEGSAPAPAANIRLLAPHNGDRLQQSFVTVQYEALNPGAAGGSPNFWIQLDGRDPVITTQTEQNFTGLGPGAHTLIVQLVDANNTPLPNSRVQARFTILPAAPQPRPATPQTSRGDGSALPQSDAADLDTPAYLANEALPSSSSALPLLSVIGFGALVGGIVSAMKTR